MASNNGEKRFCRIAVVTGANKGIGFETVKQLAAEGVTVVLTARDQNRGEEATSNLHALGLSDVVFHQLDVLDQTSVGCLADYVRDKFGRLDILVNNAGATGFTIDIDRSEAMNKARDDWVGGKVLKFPEGTLIDQTCEEAELCVDTNYYGAKRVTEALLPLLLLSPPGARIVNVSSVMGELQKIPSETLRNELDDLETLNEEKLDNILQRFMEDLKSNALEANGWATMNLPAYNISKATLNAYTRVLAKRYPQMQINCVHPGYVVTDLTLHTGTMTTEEGAKGPVKCAFLPNGGPTGCYFDQTLVAPF